MQRHLIALAAAMALCASLGSTARAVSLCGAGLQAGCRAAGGSHLVIRGPRDHGRGSFSWGWLKGAATTLEDFGAPTGTTAYGLCIYAGTSTAAIGEADVAPSARLWRSEGTTGFRYRARSPGSNGVRKVILEAGAAGNAKVAVRGGGATLPDLPPGPLPLPVTVQLVNGANNVCFEATYDGAGVARNDAEKVRAAARNASDDWPFFNHDHQNSRTNAAETKISPRNVGRLTARWRVDGLSGVTSTPVVAGGAVYFGDWSGVFHALRTGDGTEIWSRKLGQQINSSPLVFGGRVYASVNSGTLYALSRDTGDILWTATLDTQPFLSIDSSPAIAGHTIVIGIESFEQVFRKTDYAFRGNIVGLDADTGQERWRVYTTQNDETSGAGVSIWSSAAVDDGRRLIFIGSGQTYEQPASPRGDSLIAMDYETGAVAWVHQFTVGDVFTVGNGGPGPDADVGASPNLFSIGGRDVVGVGQKNGFYHVLDRETGDTVWEVQLTGGSPLGGVMVTAAVSDGVIYVNSNKWRVFGFVTTGVNSPLDTSSTFALDARDGTVLWERPMAAPMFGAMTFANGVVYQGTIDGTVHALSAKDGTELWSDAPGGGIAGGFSVAGGSLYTGRGFWFSAPPASPAGGFVAYAVP